MAERLQWFAASPKNILAFDRIRYRGVSSPLARREADETVCRCGDSRR